MDAEVSTAGGVTFEPDQEFSSWYVPDGFETYALSQTFEGPIICEGGRIEYGPRKYRYGVAHVYDRDGLRIVVRTGNAENLRTQGWYMEVETSPIGAYGQRFSNVHAALTEARSIARSHELQIRQAG